MQSGEKWGLFGGIFLLFGEITCDMIKGNESDVANIDFEL